MEQDRLATELISDATLWRLAIEVRRESIEVVILSLLQDNSLITRSIPLDTSISQLDAISKVIYDNPLVLSDFGRIDILIDTQKFCLVPAEMAGDELRADMMQVLWPHADYEVLVDDIPHSHDTLLMGVDRDILSFLRRTFPLSRISHRLTPIVRYFYNKERLNSSPIMYAHMLNDGVDVMFVRDGKINALNTFKATAVEDMTYYVLAVAQTAGYNADSDALMVCGDKKWRENIITELRKYVKHVLPVLFPSTLLSMGSDAMKAPFELIILPLCE